MNIHKILTILLLLLVSTDLIPCTMVKITSNGKTIVGNNEDFTNPDTRIWFVPGDSKHFGAVYVGYNELVPEGGMNEAGLVCDGFGMKSKPIRNNKDKETIFRNDLQQKLLQECSSIEDVKNRLSIYNLYYWFHTVWVFIDKEGRYLLADCDTMTVGANANFVHTNFRQWEVTDPQQIDCWRYKKAMSLLEQKSDPDMNYCASIMDSVHQDMTQYTTVYDLNNGIIHLYYNHDYTSKIEFDLKEELKKGAHILILPELFPEKITEAYTGTLKLKKLIYDLALPGSGLSDSAAAAQKEQYRNVGYFIHVVGNAGYEKLHTGDIDNAIAIFKLIIEMYPEAPEGYDFLGEAYMQNKQYESALLNYKRSVELEPRNIDGWQRIDAIKELLKN